MTTRSTTMTTMNGTLEHESKGKRALILIVCIAVPILLGFLSSALSGTMEALYDSLRLPPLSPPNQRFGIIWPIMYALMGIAFYLVIRENADARLKRTAVTFYIIQLVLNIFWSPVFFGGDAFIAASVIIIAMDILVAITMRYFLAVRRAAGYLLIPYLIWLLFATYLSIGVAVLNP